MRTTSQLIFLLFTLFAMEGCTNNRIPADLDQALDLADSFILFSIDPRRPASLEAARENSVSVFHGYKILGQTEVSDPAARRVLNQALRRSVHENAADLHAMCFNPRHAIRLTHSSRRYDVLMCFECLAAIVWSDGEQTGRFGPSGSAQASFDEALRRDHIPFAQGD